MAYSYNGIYTIHPKVHLDKAVRYSGGRAPLVLDDYEQGEPNFHFRIHFMPNGTCLIFNDGNDEMAQFDRPNHKLATAPTDETDTRQWFEIKPADMSDLNKGAVIVSADNPTCVWDVEASGHNAPILGYALHGGPNQRWELRPVGA